MNFYKIRLNEIDHVKKFANRIFSIESDADLISENKRHCIDAKSVMGIFSLDLTRDLTLKIEGNEEQFIKDIKDMGIYIEPISVGV